MMVLSHSCPEDSAPTNVAGIVLCRGAGPAVLLTFVNFVNTTGVTTDTIGPLARAEIMGSWATGMKVLESFW